MYKDLKEIYDKTRLDFFCMAVSYLLDKGYDLTSKLTEGDIAQIEGNGLMTKEFAQGLVRTAVKITKATNGSPVEIVQFCAAEDVFDVTCYANKLSRDRLETLLHNAIEGLQCGDYDRESLADYLDTDEDEMEMLGYEGEI